MSEQCAEESDKNYDKTHQGVANALGQDPLQGITMKSAGRRYEKTRASLNTTGGIGMKVREMLKLTYGNLPRDRFTRTVASVDVPKRIGRQQEPSGAQDMFPDADPNDSMTCGLPSIPDQSPASLPTISTPHRPDLDFIKAQIARLPSRIERQTNSLDG